MGAALVGTLGKLPQWCKKDSGDLVRLAPGCDVSFRAAPCPLSLKEEICLLGFWRRLSSDEEAKPSPARQWLAECNPLHSPDRAYETYAQLPEEDCEELFTLTYAWSIDFYDFAAIKRALCLLAPAKLERMVLTRLQGRHLHGSRTMIGNFSCVMSLRSRPGNQAPPGSQVQTLDTLGILALSSELLRIPSSLNAVDLAEVIYIWNSHGMSVSKPTGTNSKFMDLRWPWLRKALSSPIIPLFILLP